MAKKHKAKKVYIIGDIRGYYRTQNVIKFFVDRPKEYKICLNTFWSNNRIIKYFSSLLFHTWKIIFSNIVYVSILNVDVDVLYEMLIAKIFRKKIVVDYYISIYEKVVVDEHWFRETSLLSKLAKSLDKYYFNISTKSVFLSEFERDRYCKAINKPNDSVKCAVIPHCIEESFSINHRSKGDEFNICWWGSYLPLHGLDTILKAAAIVKNENINIKWCFFGNDDKKGIIYEEKAKELGVYNDCVFQNDFSMKNGKLIEYLKENCDLTLGNFGNSFKAKSLMSNKTLDACAMKSLVISGNATAYYEFFNGEDDIFLCECEPSVLAKNIISIYNLSEEERKKHIEKSYSIYQQQFKVDVFCKRFQNLLNEL